MQTFTSDVQMLQSIQHSIDDDDKIGLFIFILSPLEI